MRSEEVVFSQEVRQLCRQNRCGMYGSSWACPPSLGSVKECRDRALAYSHACMFTTVTGIENSYDMKGWIEARHQHEELTARAAAVFRAYDASALVLSTEGCLLCEKCTYPDAPCRFPERMYPATEGYGILVMQQAKKCNVKYNNGRNTVTYFSMVFFDPERATSV
jgi:predicted metal-binding protein